MSAYFSVHVQVLGPTSEVAQFHAAVLSDERKQPSYVFGFEVLAMGNLPNDLALIRYHAGRNRYRPVVEGVVCSAEFSALDLTIAINHYYEQGEQRHIVYGKDSTLYDAEVQWVGQLDPHNEDDATYLERMRRAGHTYEDGSLYRTREGDSQAFQRAARNAGLTCAA